MFFFCYKFQLPYNALLYPNANNMNAEMAGLSSSSFALKKPYIRKMQQVLIFFIKRVAVYSFLNHHCGIDFSYLTWLMSTLIENWSIKPKCNCPLWSMRKSHIELVYHWFWWKIDKNKIMKQVLECTSKWNIRSKWEETNNKRMENKLFNV